ncbi:MAG: peptidylprolyl isomerase [Xanthomonadales bacterium]|nr:peptidylprolyl isomerase [Xanthomonadales bacterium]
MLNRFCFALLCLLPIAAFAQSTTNPRVLLDTDRGPILLELDAVNTPRTTANFLSYVDDGSYNNTLVHRIVPNFVVQAGAADARFQAIRAKPSIVSERRPAPSNLRGTLAMALASNQFTGAVQRDSATSSFFINTRDNAQLDPDFTVFGRVIHGMALVDQLNAEPIFPNSTDSPVRYPLIKRAVRTSGFPILPLHSGSWYDPEKSGRGIVLEIAQSAPGTANGDQPLMVVYWYDYFEGRQVWMNGAVPFSWGASEVTVPLQITNGGQFGAAFAPPQVQTNRDWGRLTVRFTACDRGQFRFESSYGNGEYSLTRITVPTTGRCNAN